MRSLGPALAQAGPYDEQLATVILYFWNLRIKLFSRYCYGDNCMVITITLSGSSWDQGLKHFWFD